MHLETLFRTRINAGDEHLTELSTESIQYIENQLKQTQPFAVKDKRSTEVAKELATPMSRFLDTKLSLKDIGLPFTAPFLWGRVIIADDRDRKLMFRGLRKLASDSHSQDSFDVRLFYRLSNIEDFLSTTINIREGQRTWLNLPKEHYLVLVKNSSAIVPYRYHIYAFDAELHQHFMTIFFDEKISGKGDLIRLTNMAPEDVLMAENHKS